METPELSQLYETDLWPRSAQLTGRCERFVIPFGLFEKNGFRLVERTALSGVRHAYRSFYFHNNDDRRVMVDVIPAASFASAKEALLEAFHVCASLVPRSTLSQLGDVAYGDQSSQHFVRNNLLISVASAGIEEVDIRPLAQALDQEAVNSLRG